MDGNEMIIIDRLARIEVKLDEALASQLDHENRIRNLERWRYTLPIAGMTAIASAAISVYSLLSGR